MGGQVCNGRDGKEEEVAIDESDGVDRGGGYASIVAVKPFETDQTLPAVNN